MTQLDPKQPFTINLLSLSCQKTVSGKETDQVFLKYNDKKIYPGSGQRLIEFKKGSTCKFQDLSLDFPGKVDLDTIVIELWYRKNFFQNELGGRFFFMLNISEIGFSATQLIRSSSQELSHYLIHWEIQVKTPEKNVLRTFSAGKASHS